LALRRSETVQLADFDIRAAELTLKDAWALIGPTLTGTVTGFAGGDSILHLKNIQVDPTTLAIQSVTDRDVVFRRAYQLTAAGILAQPLFRRALFPAREAGRAGVEATQALSARAREQLMIDVTSAFINVLRARQQVEVAKNSAKRAEAQLAGAKTRLKVGGGNKTAELLAAIDVSRARILVIRIEGDRQATEATFERLIGIAPPGELVLPPTPEVARSLSAALDVSRVRTDRLALHHRTEQARAQTGVLKARIFWPTLDATGTVSTVYPAGFSGQSLNWSAIGLLSVPLFQTGDEWVQMRLQQVAAGQAALQESLLDKRITEDVKQAMVRLETTKQALETSVALAETATENYRLVSSQFKIGATTFLEVTNAQAALVDAENLRLVAQFDRELAVYQLLFSTGQLRL
jgi:outer membrane protein